MDLILRNAQDRAAYTRKELAENMTELGQLMLEGAEQVAYPDGHFNSLGEVQRRGTDIDRLCAVLQEQERAVEMLETDRKMQDERERGLRP